MKHKLRQQFENYSPRSMDFSYSRAGVLVPVTDSGDPEIVLTLRASSMSTHSGQVAFPGGMREEQDKTLLDTALRETEEEIGLSRDKVEIISPLSDVVSLHRILVSPYAGVIPAHSECGPELKELESVFRVPVSFFLEDRRVRTDSISFGSWKLHVPAWQWGNYQIWGLSAIVLVDFLNVGFDAGIDITRPDPKAG